MPRLLDGYGGGGGAAWGFVRAGFHVVSIDNHRRRDLPQSDRLEFVTADMLDVLADRDYLRTFDVLYGGPPCQTETALVELRKAQRKGTSKRNLIPQTREAFAGSGVPYVIENVPRSSVRPDLILCGSMFGLKVWRHRWFESSEPIGLFPPMCDHSYRPVGVYGSKGDDIPSGGSTARTLAEAREAMGIDWMSWSAIVEAIPPAYTQWIGERLLEHLAAAA